MAPTEQNPYEPPNAAPHELTAAASVEVVHKPPTDQWRKLILGGLTLIVMSVVIIGAVVVIEALLYFFSMDQVAPVDSRAAHQKMYAEMLVGLLAFLGFFSGLLLIGVGVIGAVGKRVTGQS